MSAQLIGRRVAIVADDGVDADELAQLWRSLTSVAADVALFALPMAPVLAIDAHGTVDHFVPDAALPELRAGDHAALVVPSGRGPHAQLRYHRGVARLLRTALRGGAVLATGRHAPAVLVDAGLVRGRRVTSGPSSRPELVRAGGRWIDVPVARDGGVLTTQRSDVTLLAQAIADEVAVRWTRPPAVACTGFE